MRFKARQRRTVSYFSKYVLSEKDIGDNTEPADVAEVLNFPSEKLYSEFDPENDPWDKRLLYEVTGLRLDQKDYQGEDTSSDDDADLLTQGKMARVSRQRQIRQPIDMDQYDEIMNSLIGENEQDA